MATLLMYYIETICVELIRPAKSSVNSTVLQYHWRQYGRCSTVWRCLQVHDRGSHGGKEQANRLIPNQRTGQIQVSAQCSYLSYGLYEMPRLLVVTWPLADP